MVFPNTTDSVLVNGISQHDRFCASKWYFPTRQVLCYVTSSSQPDSVLHGIAQPGRFCATWRCAVSQILCYMALRSQSDSVLHGVAQ
ncbi:hypothetical protein ElyMa_005629600 [Elysia marginata]|uniref:Uncharacterized protein n=1 Tax=Elysia marginata TaxID=1093978 RepID=A0AAV4F7P5_9GAST|nr:hypothetical protein ElyMa_005629600 [Elysia marginata]